MTGYGRVAAVTIDCPDPWALASFYRELLGGELRSANDDFVVLLGDVRLDFQRVDNPGPRSWPDGAESRRLHLDVVVDDVASVERRLCDLGARPADEQPGGDRFRVLVDPAGFPFCLVTDEGASVPPP